MYKVRLNLEAGENFFKWAVKDHANKVTFYDPSAHSFQMFSCKLVNKPKVAEKIFNGENKQVCAWIECERLHIRPAHEITQKEKCRQVFYNPKKHPFWFNTIGDNIDNVECREIITEGRNVFYVVNFP